MKITCLTVGKKHDPNLTRAIEEYEKRLRAYVEFEFEYIPASDKAKETEQIIKRLRQDDTIWLLDERGQQINNENLMKNLQQQQLTSVKRLVIIIGGAFGVQDQLRNQSNAVISISELVYPHQIIRLLVVEQLYRSFNSLAGGKYHHS